MFFKKKPYEDLLNIINKTTYSELSSFPLGEFRNKPLETKYQYKSNIFSFVEDRNYDFVVGMMLQSCQRKDSLLLIDTENILYEGARRLLKDRNYPIHLLSYRQNELDSDVWSLWGNTTSPDGLLDTSKEIIDAVFLYLNLLSSDDRSYSVLIYVFASLLSYAVTTSMLVHNKFNSILEFINENPLSEIITVLGDLNDTTEYLWKEMEPTEEEYEQALGDSKKILELLAEDNNNSLIAQDSYELLSLSLQKSATIIEYTGDTRREAVLNIISNSILTENLLYHERQKGRAQCIDVVINKIENISNRAILFDLFSLAKKYKVNFFASCYNTEKLLYNLELTSLEDISEYFPFIVIQKNIKNDDALLAVSGNIGNIEYNSEYEEILIADNKSIVLDKYDTTKHSLYEVFAAQ